MAINHRNTNTIEVNRMNGYIKNQLDFGGLKVIDRLSYEKALFNILMKVKQHNRG